MANRIFENEGFYDRLEEAIKESGMTKLEISERMGVNRKSLYSTNNKMSWHSGRLVSFCKITGVSADWLLGLSEHKKIR